ncbi:hypothetical protein X777_09205 [Ooceraea biroi]|uniref:Uncharacterized protein n=1 Tax=Ooceraea biroi TaxID=2015173 RepID=A0A026W7M1_OOCBI|nr:hypothetical protein X777_09205 [Ooceraea biroi]
MEKILRCVQDHHRAPQKPAIFPIRSLPDMDAFEGSNEDEYSNASSDYEDYNTLIPKKKSRLKFVFVHKKNRISDGKRERKEGYSRNKRKNLDERIKDIASQITDKTASNLSDAKELFVHTAKRFEDNKANFLKAGDTFMYIDAAYNVTLTYKYLECFQPDRNIRIKMHKRRVQMLKDICVVAKGSTDHTLFLSNFYMDIFISCSAIIDVMMENAEIAEKSFTEIETEVFEYVKTCVESLKSFCNLSAEM